MASAERILLVTGAGGKLGRLLRRYWEMSAPKGWRVVWLSRADGSWPLQAPVRADAVLALWGVTPGGGDLSMNVTLAQEAMTLAQQCGAGRVLQCSSSAVYGPGVSLSEEGEAAPVTDYGKAKLAMERWVQANPVDGIETCLMRMANVVGAESLFGAIERPGVLTLDRFSDGQGPRRSYLSVSRFSETVLALLETVSLPDVVNVANPTPVAMEALVQATGKAMQWRDAPDGAVPVVVLLTAKLDTVLGSSEPVGADEMIAEWRALGGETA